MSTPILMTETGQGGQRSHLQAGSVPQGAMNSTPTTPPVIRPEAWLFSWGYGQEHPNRYVRIEGTYFEARAEMIRRYGRRWAFQYPASDEAKLIANDMRPWPEGPLEEQKQP